MSEVVMIIILSRTWFALSLLSYKMSSVSVWHLVDNCIIFDQLIFGIVSSWTRILIALHVLRFTLNRVGMSTFSDGCMLVIGSRGWQVLLVFRNYIRSLVFADLHVQDVSCYSNPTCAARPPSNKGGLV